MNANGELGNYEEEPMFRDEEDGIHPDEERLNDNQNKVFGDISLMICKPDQVLDEVLTYTTLEDGDLVMTGSPKRMEKVDSGKTYTATLYDHGENILEATWKAE